jgi:hypothetical protein
VEKLHAHRIALQGCFVFGLDGDEPDVFLKTAQCVDEIDLPRFAIVTPFPNTGLQALLSEERILHLELYDGQHVVFQPKRMTIQSWEEPDGLEACIQCASILSPFAFAAVGRCHQYGYPTTPTT